MENNFDLDRRENFRINPQVWLQTLLAIAGDKDMKEDVIQRIAHETGCPSENIEALLSKTIRILMSQNHSN